MPVTPVEELTGFPECLDGGSRPCTRGARRAAGRPAQARPRARSSPSSASTPFELVVVNLYPFARDRRLRRDAGRVRRADRHRRPVDGARRRQEPPERRGRRRPGAATTGCSTPCAAGGFTLAERRQAGGRGVRAHRRRTTSRSRPGWAASLAPDDGARLPGVGRRDVATRRRCCATARTRTSRPRSTPPSTPARPGPGRAAARQGDVLQQLRRRRRRLAGRVRPRRAGASRSSSTPTRAASRSASTSREAHRKAHDCDPVSAFGGVIATNRPVTRRRWPSTSPTIFTEVDRGAGLRRRTRSRCCTRKKNIRLLRCAGEPPAGGASCAPISGGLLVQQRDAHRRAPATTRRTGRWSTGDARRRRDAGRPGLRLAGLPRGEVQRDPARRRRRDRRRRHGPGQPGRLGPAGGRAGRRAGAPGAVAASDAFFPFPDGLEMLIDAGVRGDRAAGRLDARRRGGRGRRGGRRDHVPHRRRGTSSTESMSGSEPAARPLHVAQLNIARLLGADRLAQAGRVRAPRSTRSTRRPTAAPGFVWRLQSESGNATDLRPWGDDVIVNMSVWESVEHAAGLRLRP